MTTQAKALRLADELENGDCFDVGSSGVVYGWMRNDPTGEAASELRRLHEVNQELLEALKLIYEDMMDYGRRNNLGGEDNHVFVVARAAIARAEGGA